MTTFLLPEEKSSRIAYTVLRVPSCFLSSCAYHLNLQGILGSLASTVAQCPLVKCRFMCLALFWDYERYVSDGGFFIILSHLKRLTSGLRHHGTSRGVLSFPGYLVDRLRSLQFGCIGDLGPFDGSSVWKR